MQHSFKIATLVATGALLTAMAASAAGMLADEKGMTLYVFDKDKGGVSACYDDCATKWPPYLAKADQTMGAGWTMVDRKDGTKQWAYDKKPVYFYFGDKAKGDKTGDGLGGVWHIVNE